MTMKRSRGEDREVEALAMANCLKLLSRVGRSVNLDGRVFECKICNKQFQSSQALGGHCARHKMPTRSRDSDDADGNDHKRPRSSIPGKSKIHECSICGLDFPVGQALGGHMRRHRADHMKEGTAEQVKIPVVLKRSNSKRIFCLDLNLTPYENEMKLGYQKSLLLI